MTCITAFRLKDKIILAGDKMGSDLYTSAIVKEPKVFQKDDFFMGYTSSFRMGQILKHCWVPPTRKVAQTTDNYLYVDVVASLKETFKESGYGDSTTNAYGNFIMIFENRIIAVQEDCSLLEYETDVVSCGSGEYHAVAALQVLLQYEKKIDRILDLTYEIVSYNIISVSDQYDYLVINAKGELENESN